MKNNTITITNGDMALDINCNITITPNATVSTTPTGFKYSYSRHYHTKQPREFTYDFVDNTTYEYSKDYKFLRAVKCLRRGYNHTIDNSGTFNGSNDCQQNQYGSSSCKHFSDKYDKKISLVRKLLYNCGIVNINR